MENQKIKLRTENDQFIEVTVTSMKADGIWVAVGEGLHNVKCKLVPSRNQLAYVGTLMGRELIYPCSVKQVQAEIARQNREPLPRIKR
jgi:hypothetical protein